MRQFTLQWNSLVTFFTVWIANTIFFPELRKQCAINMNSPYLTEMPLKRHIRHPTYPLCQLGVHHEVVDVFFGPRELHLSREHSNEERRTAGALKWEERRRHIVRCAARLQREHGEWWPAFHQGNFIS